MNDNQKKKKKKKKKKCTNLIKTAALITFAPALIPAFSKINVKEPVPALLFVKSSRGSSYGMHMPSKSMVAT
jgi:hypothetical protein